MHDFFPKQWLKRVKKKKIPRIIQTSDCITVWESSFLMTCPIILLKTGPHPHSIVVFLLNIAINLKSTFQISFGNGNFNWKLYLLVFAFLANIHDIRDRIDFGATPSWISYQWCIRTKFYLFFSAVIRLPSTFFTVKKLRLGRQVVFLI